MSDEHITREAAAIIAAIETVTETAKLVADGVAKELHLHTAHDDERFDRLTVLVTSIAEDTQSLLRTRAFAMGIGKTLVIIGGSAGTVAAAVTFLMNHLKIGTWFQ